MMEKRREGGMRDKGAHFRLLILLYSAVFGLFLLSLLTTFKPTTANQLQVTKSPEYMDGPSWNPTPNSSCVEAIP